MNKSNIIIVDDHDLYRLGLRSIIEKNIPEISIIAEYSSGKELLHHLENKTIPQLVMLDILMPGISGVELAEIIRKKYPEIKILVVSSEVSVKVIGELLDIGVEGYLSKLTTKKYLVSALNVLLEGEKFYGQEITKILYNVYVSKQNSQTKGWFKADKKEVKLTAQEKKIIELLCDGLSSKKIAEELFISPRTVDNHKTRIMQKLNFHSTVELVKYAIKEGIIVL